MFTEKKSEIMKNSINKCRKTERGHCLKSGEKENITVSALTDTKGYQCLTQVTIITTAIPIWKKQKL